MTKKTKLSERILYGLIALFMLGSTVIMYVTMILSNNTTQPKYDNQVAQEKALEKLQKKYAEYSEYMQSLNKDLTAKYYPEFSAYRNSNQAYNAESIKELVKTDLKEGDGEVVGESTAYRAYYIGWLADGKVFDSSFDGEALKTPIEGGEGLIAGWKEGIVGMKIGGVRELAIPADKAYGDQASGEIPANSPLKFIIKLIPPMTAEEKAKVPDLGF